MNLKKKLNYLKYLKKTYKDLNYYNQFILVPIKDKMKILDYGCGLGGLLQKIYLINKKVKLYGVDIDGKIIKEAIKNCKFADIKKITANQKISARKGYFDLIFCLDVIEHSQKPINILKEIKRVLSPDGKVILCTPDLFSFWIKNKSDNLSKSLIFNIRRLFRIDVIDPTHKKELSVYDLNFLIKQAGFKKVKTNTKNLLHFLPFISYFFRDPSSFIWVLSHS